MAKRLVIQLENMQNAKKMPPPDWFPAILTRAGQEKYGDVDAKSLSMSSSTFFLAAWSLFDNFNLIWIHLVYHRENPP